MSCGCRDGDRFNSGRTHRFAVLDQGRDDGRVLDRALPLITQVTGRAHYHMTVQRGKHEHLAVQGQGMRGCVGAAASKRRAIAKQRRYLVQPIKRHTPFVVSVGSGCNGWVSSGLGRGDGVASAAATAVNGGGASAGSITTYCPLRHRTVKCREMGDADAPPEPRTAMSCTWSAKLPVVRQVHNFTNRTNSSRPAHAA
jgi:hypothetical protein